MSKTKSLTRIAALFLVALTLFGSVFALHSSAASTTITFDYCYSTTNSIIKFVKEVKDGSYTVGTKGEELCRIYADGKDAYCIEPGRSLHSGDTMNDSSTAWKNLGEAKRTAVNLAILFGKGGNSSKLGGTTGQQWIATQLIVWEIVTGCRNTTGEFKCTNTKYIEGICANNSNPGVRSIYNKISGYLANYSKIPSFTKATQKADTTYDMDYKSGKYTLTLTDSNKILGEFNFKTTGGVSLSKSGNSLTLSSSKAVNSAVTFSSAKSLPASGGSAIVAYGDTNLQDVVKGVGKADPINAYFKVVAKSGNLDIVKTSEDGKVSGITFKITGTNYSKTATTDKNGKINLTDLVPGTYKVTETTPDKYVPQETHTVEVVEGKTAKVTFNNKLKRGNLEVVKTSDDNFVEGVKFHLYGTSKEGIKVDEYATTNAKGVAKFTDILISDSKGYTLEEVNTPDKYLLPAKQSAVIKWKETTKKSFHNTLKKATVFTISKTGEVFYDVTSTDGDNGKVYQPVYKSVGLAGAEFEVKAAADIVTDDGKKYYSKGDIVDTIITGDDGVAKSKQLYLGKYTITETKAPYGMVINSQPQTVELTTANQEVALSETKLSFVNNRQKASVDLLKALERNDTFNIGNGDEIKNIKFGLYADEKLTATKGTNIPKDGLIEVISVDEGGKAQIKSDLPLGKYYVKEIATDEHYIIGTDKLTFAFTYGSQTTKTQNYTLNDGKAYENKLIYGEVNGIKTDENGKNLAGALIGLFKADETEFTEATAILKDTSGANGSFKFTKIPYGKYLVREIKQPTGYVINNKTYPVEIKENAQVVDITIVNETIKGNITLTKIDANFPENKLTGATFELYSDVNADGKLDKDDKLIGNLDEENEGIYVKNDLTYGKYLVRETEAPEGFELDKGVYSVNIEEDGKTYAVENKAGVGFINMAKKGSLKIVKRSEDNKVEGFSFRVTGVDGFDETFKTDENGVIEIEGLRIGEYKVSEVEDTASNSYVLPDDETLEIKANETTEIEMYNKLKDIPKTGDNSNMPLWFGIGGVSLLGIAAALFVLLRKKKGGNN